MTTNRFRSFMTRIAACGALTWGASALGAQAASRGAGFPKLDSARLIADISALAADSMEGRRVGTPGGARARAFLVRRLKELGLPPTRDSFPQPFATQGRGGAAINGVNLVATIKGTKHNDRYVVVSAHYDHLGVRNGDVFNGADDNASGTAAVLAIGQWFKAHPPENAIILALFDAEEAGDLGSKAFVAAPPVPLGAIVADVNLDMVSRNEKGELWAAGATPWPVMRHLLETLVPVAPVTLKLGHDSGGGHEDWTNQSDQGAFNGAKIPWVYFGVEDHPDYHKATDEVQRIQPGFYFRSATTVAEFVRRLDASLDAVAIVRASAP